MKSILTDKTRTRFNPDTRPAKDIFELLEQYKQQGQKGQKEPEQQEPETNSAQSIPEGQIQTLIYNDLGKQVLEAMNKEFKGTRIEDKTKYKDNQPITYLNTPRALFYNLYLLQNHNAGLLSPEEVVQNWGNIPERDSTYADTNAVAIYHNQGVNGDRRQEVLRLIGKPSITVPHIVYNLGVRKADNEQGFTLTDSDFRRYEEQPLFTKNCRIAFNNGKFIESDSGIQIYVPDEQDGLRRVFRYWSLRLIARFDDLLFSGGSGRVQFYARRVR